MHIQPYLRPPTLNLALFVSTTVCQNWQPENKAGHRLPTVKSNSPSMFILLRMISSCQTLLELLILGQAITFPWKNPVYPFFSTYPIKIDNKDNPLSEDSHPSNHLISASLAPENPNNQLLLPENILFAHTFALKGQYSITCQLLK